MRYVYGQMAKVLQGAEATVPERLEAALRLGRAGEAARGALPMLRDVAADRDQDILVRGYAAWAAEAIAPRPEDEPGRIFHVAQKSPNAFDANPGTSERPWKTIQRAAETLRPGDTVVIHEGVYREEVRPFLGGTSYDRMVTYRTAEGERPVLKGSDLWQPEWKSEGDRLWSAPYQRHAWDEPEKWPSPEKGAMHRAEQVFVDGKLLVHVDTMRELSETPGTMFTDDEAGRLWVHFRDDRAPAEHVIERSVRQQVFAPAVRGLGYLRVQGLAMLHAAAPESNGADWRVIGHRAMLSVRAGHHWIIEDNVIEWGNAQGMDVGGEGFSQDLAQQPRVTDEPAGWHQVRRNSVNYHGVAGIVGWNSGENHLLLENNETNYNCQKGNFYQYEAAGVKLHNARDCLIRRHRSHENEAFGIWLDYNCEGNRITQCLLTENRGAGVFFEVSAGPLLVDTNVILGTRDAPRGDWGEGIYSHDGNRATYINNFIQGCTGYGVRLRNLFSRVANGKPTTTSHNRVVSNFLLDNGRGAVSLNPEVPKAEDNQSDHNLLWQGGRPISLRLEDAGSGVKWEATDIGRVLGRSGGGDVTADLSLWQDAVGRDRHSLPVPTGALFAGLGATGILDKLRALWPEQAPGLDEGYGEVEPRPAEELVAALAPELADARLVRTVWYAPDGGVQLWTRDNRLLGLVWEGRSGPLSLDFTEHVLLDEPSQPPEEEATVAAGDEVRLPVPDGAKVLVAGLDAEVRGQELVVSAPANAPPGEYAVVLVTDTQWWRLPVQVEEPFAVRRIASALAGGAAVTVEVENRLSRAEQATFSLQIGQAEVTHTEELGARTTATVRLPVQVEGAGRATVKVEMAGRTVTCEAPVSFAVASRAADWSSAPRYRMDDFPGGAFPEGAEAFVLYQGGLSARWAARYDSKALYLRVEVDDDQHVQDQKPEELWKQDSVQLLLRAAPGAAPLEMDLARPTQGGAAVVYRRLSPDEERYPVGVAQDVKADVNREGRLTTYEVTIPWEMLGLEQAPEPGTGPAFSVLVNDDDGKGRYGLQWFFGIHTHRGQEERMGVLWIQ